MTCRPAEPLAWYGNTYSLPEYLEANSPTLPEEDALAAPEWRSEHRFPRGLVAGRFLPVHRGHQFLIDFARARCKELVIAVRKQEGDPIAQRHRLAWLKELYPTCQVIGDEDYGPIQAVFSSERAHADLAERLGASLVLCDPERRIVPITGTRVRAQPLVHWRYLPDCVRPYFLKVVRVVGPEGRVKPRSANVWPVALKPVGCRSLPHRWLPKTAAT